MTCAVVSGPQQTSGCPRFKFGAGLLPFFLIVNVFNLLIGVVAVFWGLVELTQPQDTYAYASSFPFGLMIGPFMIGIGFVLVARIRNLSNRIPLR